MAEFLESAKAGTIFNVREYGCSSDGTTQDTAALQTAIDECARSGGGTVFVPPGKYLTGTLFLRSNVNLHLAATAVILGSTNLQDYATGIVRCGFVNETAIDKCLIYAEDAENVSITGPGTIDGQGWAFPVRTPDGALGERPMLVRFVRCRRVRFSEVTLKNAGAWCSHFRLCKDVQIRGVNIHNRVNQNNDGIDLMSTQNVCISDCTIICQDDAICFQDMSDEDPVRDIVVTNCIMSTRWAAIRSGGAHRGGIRNVTVSNCVIYDTYGCGIKLQISGNAVMENMTFSNIVMENVSSPISLRFGNHHYNNEQRDERFPFGTMRNLMFNNIRANVVDERTLRASVPDLYEGEERQCISIVGIPDHPIENVTLSDILVTFPGGGTKEDAAKRDMPEYADAYPEYFLWGVLPAYGLYARHAKKLTLHNVRFDLATRDLRPAVVCDDVEDLELSSFRAAGDAEAECLVRLEDTRTAFIRGCRPTGNISTFLRVEGETSREIVVGENDLRKATRHVDLTDGATEDAIVRLS